MGIFIDLTGKKFGRLKVLERTEEKTKYNQIIWNCICDCGNYKKTTGTNMKSRKVLSCGCLDKQSRSDRHKLRPYESLYRILKRVAKTRDHKLDLTYEDFLKYTKEKECHYCKNKIYWKEYLTLEQSHAGYNLDRLNNNEGYSIENCVVCCGVCNKSKADRFTYEQWKSIGKHIQEHPEIFGEPN